MREIVYMDTKYTLIKIYEWNDIVKTICADMGIEEENFRDYHKVIGGKSKDLWHVALDSVLKYNDVRNDCIHRLTALEDDELSFYKELLKEETFENYGDWVDPFLKSFIKIINTLADDPDEGIWVHFYW